MQKRTTGAVHEVAQRPVAFAAVFFAFFVALYVLLSVLGATPNPISSSADSVPQSTGAAATTNVAEEPVRIVAPSISLDATVVNPASTDISVLDDALTQGAARYPTTALLGQDGTMVIFGHSSYLPVVYHQYYKTFDGIQNLKHGDTVSVYSGTTEYRYSVVGVRIADANDTGSDVIDLPQTGRHLTLITCDSFAQKSNRFVVTADFVGAYALSQ
jgi:LPXTG-site transpeptidase (sortase) family protein